MTRTGEDDVSSKVSEAHLKMMHYQRFLKLSWGWCIIKGFWSSIEQPSSAKIICTTAFSHQLLPNCSPHAHELEHFNYRPPIFSAVDKKNPVWRTRTKVPESKIWRRNYRIVSYKTLCTQQACSFSFCCHPMRISPKIHWNSFQVNTSVFNRST